MPLSHYTPHYMNNHINIAYSKVVRLPDLVWNTSFSHNWYIHISTHLSPQLGNFTSQWCCWNLHSSDAWMAVRALWIIRGSGNKKNAFWLFEWMMHLYSNLFCIAVNPKRFTIMWGVSLQPPPVCSIHLDDATAATGQQRQCAHYTPATGGEERESKSQSSGWD